MPAPDNLALSARLRRLPGHVLLALLDGTAILVIVASVFALVAYAKINHLAHNVATTMTDAVLSRVAVKPAEFRKTLQGVSADIQELSDALKERKTEAADTLNPAIERLHEWLAALEMGVERLGDARVALINHVVTEVSVSVGQALQRFGACKAGPTTVPGPAPMTP